MKQKLFETKLVVNMSEGLVADLKACAEYEGWSLSEWIRRTCRSTMLEMFLSVGRKPESMDDALWEYEKRIRYDRKLLSDPAFAAKEKTRIEALIRDEANQQRLAHRKAFDEEKKKAKLVEAQKRAIRDAKIRADASRLQWPVHKARLWHDDEESFYKRYPEEIPYAGYVPKKKVDPR